MNLFIAIILLIIAAAVTIRVLSGSGQGKISAQPSAEAGNGWPGNHEELVSAVITALVAVAVFGSSEFDDLMFIAISMLIAGVAILGVCKLRTKWKGGAQVHALTAANHEHVRDDRLEISEAKIWAADFGDDFSGAWRQCPKVEWLCYLAGYLNCNRKEMILAGNDCIFYARDHPGLADIDDFPDSGQMFAWMVLNSDQFNSRTKQFNIVERWSRGEASVDDCREAEMHASETAASIYPGDCQNGWEADEAELCGGIHDAIKYLLRAILVLEALQNEDVAPELHAQKSTIGYGCVCDAFQHSSNLSDGAQGAGREALFIFNLAMAVKEASSVINLKAEPSRLASLLRGRVMFPEGGMT